MIIVSFLGPIVSVVGVLLLVFSRKEMVSVKVAISTLTGLKGLYSRITAFSMCEEYGG